MQISTRLKLTGLFSAVAIAIIGVVLLLATQQVRRDLARNERAGEILYAASSVRYLTLEYVARPEERVRAQWQLRHASLATLLASEAEFTGKEEQAILDRLRHTHQGVNALFAELVANRKTREVEKGKAAVLEELEARLTGQIMNKAQSMISDALSLSDRSRAGVLSAQQQAGVTVAVFGVIVVSVIAAILFITVRNVIRPLAKLREGTAVVGAGNLDYRLAVTARDEIGELSRAFDQMTERLKGTTVSRDELVKGNDALQLEIAERKRAEESLHKLMQETEETVSVLSSSVTEILAGTTQVAAGANETATAMSETATTVEEVKQTVTLTSEKARLVDEAAQQAAQVSQSGRKAVEESTDGMQRIREQMEQIAESIVRLAEQGQAIGEIIATVNDLSEQSNLLAVNASIEAAKAGEQGRGFAVVAQEVRSLAEQSKQATAQVRTILSDIQKATSAAVLATEQGSKAVEAGVRQSQDAGEAIRQMAEGIAESAQAANQIAVSAQQQLAGMDQLAQAMANIRLATTQNLESTRQAESAAHNLNELGQKLKQLVVRYSV